VGPTTRRWRGGAVGPCRAELGCVPASQPAQGREGGGAGRALGRGHNAEQGRARGEGAAGPPEGGKGERKGLGTFSYFPF
jgi:hypothetical protein